MILAERSVGGWVTLAAVVLLIAIYLRNLRKEYVEQRDANTRDYFARIQEIRVMERNERKQEMADLEARVDAVFYDQGSEAQ